MNKTQSYLKRGSHPDIKFVLLEAEEWEEQVSKKFDQNLIKNEKVMNF